MDNVRELMAKRAALLSQADAILKKALEEDRETTVEENTQVDALTTQADNLKATIERADRTARMMAELGPQNHERRADPVAPNSNEAQRKRDEVAALARYVRRGDASGLMDLLAASNDTDMNIGTPADGGYAVPTGHYQGIIAKRDAMSLVGTLGCLRIPGVGTTVNVPIDDGTANQFVLTTEANSFDRDAPALGQAAMTLAYYTKKVTLSNQLLNDEDSNLLAFLNDYVGRAAALTYNALLFTEVLANGTSVALGTAAAATSGDPETLMYNLKGEYGEGAAFVMRRATEGAYRKLTGNLFLYQSTPAGVVATRPTLSGFPVYNSESMAAIGAGNKSVAFGNFAYVGYRESPGMTFLRDPYSAAATGQVNLFYYFAVVFKVLIAEAVLYGKHPTA
ncbi:MAG: phage major capsid protein [Deltaproteobacteria bacterium]